MSTPLGSWMPYIEEDIKTGKVNPESPKDPKLIIFDLDYKYVGDVILDKNKKYFSPNIIIDEEGLWMQRMTEHEDFMSFELIDFEITADR